MESGAKGCEVIVSGKLCAQRAKSMKFKDGYLVSSGQPVKDYIDLAVRHVLRQGVLGIKVKIMFDWDPKGKQSLTTPLPDLVTIQTPNHTSLACNLWVMRHSFISSSLILKIISQAPVFK